MTKPKSTNSRIRDLAKILDETGLTEIEVEEGDLKIRVARGGTTHVAAHVASAPQAPAAAAAPAPEAAAPVDPASHPGVVKSPMVGTAFIAPEPGADDFVKVGDQVAEGQTLLIVEAMKVMNPIPAPHAGVVKEIFISNAQPIEFDEPLMIIE